MAQLLVRNLPEEVKKRLQRRAQRHGRSLEAEVREILTYAPDAMLSKEPAAKPMSEVLIDRFSDFPVDTAEWSSLDGNLAAMRRDERRRDVEFDT